MMKPNVLTVGSTGMIITYINLYPLIGSGEN